MTDEARTVWNNQHNFLSQFDFMWQIVDELNAAASMAEVRRIQAEYSDIMLFNNNPADEDISPYIPSNYRGTEFVCNRNGDVLINGEVKNYNNLTSYEQTTAYEFNNRNKTRAREYLAGEAAVSGKRKFWVEAYLNTSTGWIELQLSAHSKGLFGWNNYKTCYFLKITEFVNWGAVTNFTTDILSARPNYYETADMSSGNYFPFVAGRANPSSQARFYIHAFSRGVGAENDRSFGVVSSPTPLTKAIDGYFELNSGATLVK